ncbi:polyvinyl alcohol dehydrogenase (cytochrome) [Actinokineospora globicatena]|uniref:outer membrane protein assembly factor BamB family protein n=1 Tax=Actinokineospora globicatena TaxID=103729 RepID=UPI0020A23D2C|nr:PQQ-binding-like beta-propeller repeat protein [Actinokineospora globicatena]MCP2304548.1 polyvinyl alcohol dehydrogenase (cytochrome) [Actinokineospora globicatena]GLW78083.1 cytochrome CBB3 [Actinokineospora globicatena]GLW85251.1 cytochrome CBB3 [Actinokineospora globicatena]
MSHRKRRVLAVTALAVLLVGGQSAAAGAPVGGGHRPGDWPTWTGDKGGSRFASAEHRINPRTAGKLTLKWAFAYPKNGFPAKSQPAVVGDTIYFGSPDGKFHALDARSGAARWSFDLGTVAPRAVVIDGPTVAKGKVYFGDTNGYIYALEQRTGKLVWAKDTEPHAAGQHTSSPLYHDGRIYVGASSGENVTPDRNYPCCTFRGHIDSLDAETGELAWRYFTVPEPKAVGTWPSGATRYEPSGAGVWSSPIVDERTGTLYVGTGNLYSGTTGDFDTLLALNARSGAVKWKQQVTKADTWRLLCGFPDAEGYCPGQKDGTALDYDLGATPTLFQVRGRTYVGIGQKSGVFHAFDARSGQPTWRRQLSVPMPGGGLSGVQWGTSFDGRNIYVATNWGNPGTLFALNPANGDVVWQTESPADGCTTGGAAQHPTVCKRAHTPAVTSSPGLVYEGSVDGKMRVYDAKDGKVLWTFDTIRDFQGVNGLTGSGSAISGNGGAVVANGMLYIQSGYWPAYPSDHGNVLLAFGL